MTDWLIGDEVVVPDQPEAGKFLIVGRETNWDDVVVAHPVPPNTTWSEGARFGTWSNLAKTGRRDVGQALLFRLKLADFPGEMVPLDEEDLEDGDADV